MGEWEGRPTRPLHSSTTPVTQTTIGFPMGTQPMDLPREPLERAKKLWTPTANQLLQLTERRDKLTSRNITLSVAASPASRTGQPWVGWTLSSGGCLPPSTNSLPAGWTPKPNEFRGQRRLSGRWTSLVQGWRRWWESWWYWWRRCTS